MKMKDLFILCSEEEGPVSLMNDLKLMKAFFLSIENFRIPEMLFDGLDVYLRHILNIVPWNTI